VQILEQKLKSASLDLEPKNSILFKNQGVTLLKRPHVQTLLDDGPGSAGLQVKLVLRVLGQRSHASVEVRALGVGHDLKRLLASWRCW
jgi:hypothetical protein